MLHHIEADGAASSRDLATGDSSADDATDTTRTTTKPLPTLLVAAQAEWFQIDGAPVFELSTRLALRKLLAALVTARLHTASGALTSPDCFNAGWPGERAHPNAASVRVYTAIHTLRSFGLREILIRQNGGYTLEANVRVAAPYSQFPSAMTEEEQREAANERR